MQKHILCLGKDNEDAIAQLVGHRATGLCYLWLGRVPQARIELEQALVLYDMQQRRSFAFRFGHDPGATSLAFLACVMWILGYPKEGETLQQQAVAHALKIEHWFTLAYVLTFACEFDALRGDFSSLKNTTGWLQQICREHDIPTWGQLAEYYECWGQKQSGW